MYGGGRRRAGIKGDRNKRKTDSRNPANEMTDTKMEEAAAPSCSTTGETAAQGPTTLKLIQNDNDDENIQEVCEVDNTDPQQQLCSYVAG
ncbi:unnamed protein product, partial [Amoebophrya sp. A120]